MTHIIPYWYSCNLLESFEINLDTLYVTDVNDENVDFNKLVFWENYIFNET